MKLTQKETSLLKDLQTQEQLCVQKYEFYEKQAKDPELKKLFNKIKGHEEHHHEMLGQLLQGELPNVKEKKADFSASYKPKATYGKSNRCADKKHDAFLCTDSITTEKYVSSAYDNDLFRFASPQVRKALNEIQTIEQNHAEMIYLYKEANSMVQ